jgi:hypothetical protein
MDPRPRYGIALIWLSLGLYVLAFGSGFVGARLLPIVFHS